MITLDRHTGEVLHQDPLNQEDRERLSRYFGDAMSKRLYDQLLVYRMEKFFRSEVEPSDE